MNPLNLPTSAEKEKILSDLKHDLRSFSHESLDDHGCRTLNPCFCSICDSIPREENWWEWVDIGELSNLLKKIPFSSKQDLAKYYSKNLLDCYTVPGIAELEPYVLSSESQVNRHSNKIIVCKHCINCMREEMKQCKRSSRKMPKEAICSGYLIGNVPEELQGLNEIEVALISRVRVHAHIFSFYGGQHKSIKGWHTFFRNNHVTQKENLETLAKNQLQGNVFVVLSGPFTTKQRDRAKEAVEVNVPKVLRAIEWLVKNNPKYKNDPIPTEQTLPMPILLEDSNETLDKEPADFEIENKISYTVVFPDKELPEPTNGGFKNQEEFLKFVAAHQNGKWDSRYVAKHGTEQVPDFKGDEFAGAFPLLFPYGHTGLPEDPAVVGLSKVKGRKSFMKRDRLNVLKKFLQHRRVEFHCCTFNLVVQNMIMRETIFKSAVINCNTKRNEHEKMGQAFGSFSSEQFMNAVQDARVKNARSFGSQPAHQFLRSIHATCGQLPHSNEAVTENRRRYFSYLMKFGLPSMMLTVTPNDEHSFRIVLYTLPKSKTKSMTNMNVDVTQLNDEDIFEEFTIRAKARVEYPGICAEEYNWMIRLVVKHVIGWDEEKCQRRTQKGLLGNVEAFCLATEEQQRKTLHGHFLIWVKHWNSLIQAMQCNGNAMFQTRSVAEHIAKEYFENVCSARLFQDCSEVNGELRDIKVFDHVCCSETKTNKRLRISMIPASDQALHEMRHKDHLQKHEGRIAMCPVCNKQFDVNSLVTHGLRKVTKDPKLSFPDITQRLSRHVIENQKGQVTEEASSARNAAEQYFTSNALVNVHLVSHTNRCFKKSRECFASLPDCYRAATYVEYAKIPDTWYDWAGRQTRRTMFRFYPRRNIEDAYINTHHPGLTQCLTCNTNVIVGTNGRSAFYCTCYNCKDAQKEEALAFENVCKPMVRTLKKAEENPNSADCLPSQVGFRRLLAGVFMHTRAHTTAAPMAHYMALHGSRFTFSHGSVKLAAYGTENFLLDNRVLMSLRKDKNGKMVPFHACFHYLYRNAKFENLCFYEFLETAEVIRKSEAEKQVQETFDFSEDHPLSHSYTTILRTKTVLPCFPWGWLPTTKSFSSSILQHAEKQNADYFEKENYARRFLILFYRFREHKDLQLNNSYAERLRNAIEFQLIPGRILDIANNIQNIRNSLDSTLMDNHFPEDTHVEDEHNDDMEDDDEEEEFFKLQDILQQTGEFVVPPHYRDLCEEQCSSSFSPICEDEEYETDTKFEELNDCFQSFDEAIPKRRKTTDEEWPERFTTSHHTFNALILENFLESQESIRTSESQQINATGSWQSIIAWGKNSKLDPEQQTAFEVLASTFVLGFLDEAYDITSQSTTSKENYKALEKLARRKDRHSSEPLIMFITGPAGAGKCKSLLRNSHIAVKFIILKVIVLTHSMCPKHAFWMLSLLMLDASVKILDMHFIQEVFGLLHIQDVQLPKLVGTLLLERSSWQQREIMLHSVIYKNLKIFEWWLLTKYHFLTTIEIFEN